MEHIIEDYLKSVEYGTEDEDMWINVLENHKLYKNEDFDYEVVEVKVVQNAALRAKYDLKRNEFLKKGYGEEEIKSCYGFAIEMDHNMMDLIINGPFNRPAQYHILGNNDLGFRVWRHADVCMKFASKRSFKNATLVIYKFMYGKRKHVLVDRFRRDPNDLTPSVGYDCYVPAVSATPTSTLCNNINNSQIYLYDIDECTLSCSQPCQIYPIAVLSLIKKSVLELLEDQTQEKCEENEDARIEETQPEEKELKRLFNMMKCNNFTLDGENFPDFPVSKSMECKLSTAIDEPLPENFHKLLSVFHHKCLSDRFAEVNNNDWNIQNKMTDIDKEVVKMKPRIKFSNLGRGYTDISHGLKWVKLKPLSCYNQYDSNDEQPADKQEENPISMRAQKPKISPLSQKIFSNKLPNIPQTNRETMIKLEKCEANFGNYSKSSQSLLISPPMQEPFFSPELKNTPIKTSILVRVTERLPKSVPVTRQNQRNTVECLQSTGLTTATNQNCHNIVQNNVEVSDFQEIESEQFLSESLLENSISPGFSKSSDSQAHESPMLENAQQTCISPNIVKDIFTADSDIVATKVVSDIFQSKGQYTVQNQSAFYSSEMSTESSAEKKVKIKSSAEIDDVARNLKLLTDLINSAPKDKTTRKENSNNNHLSGDIEISSEGSKTTTSDAFECIAEAEQNNALITSVNDLILKLNDIDNSNAVFDIKDWMQQFCNVSDGVNQLIHTTNLPQLPNLTCTVPNLNPVEPIKKEEMSKLKSSSFFSRESKARIDVQTSDIIAKTYNQAEHMETDRKEYRNTEPAKPTVPAQSKISPSSVLNEKDRKKVLVKFHGRTLLKGKEVPPRQIPLFPIYLKKPFKSNGEPMEIPIDPRKTSMKLDHVSISQLDLPIPPFVFDEHSIKNIKFSVPICHSKNKIHGKTPVHRKIGFPHNPISENEPITSSLGQHMSAARKKLTDEFKKQICYPSNSATCINNNVDNLHVVDMLIDSSDGELPISPEQSRYITIKPISAQKHKLERNKIEGTSSKREKLDRLMSRNEQHDLLETVYDKWKQKDS